MSIPYSLLGLSVSSRDGALESDVSERIELLNGFTEAGKLGYGQVYIVPGTTRDDLERFRDVSFKTIVHAAHEEYMWCPVAGLTDANKRTLHEALDAAAFLGSEVVVFHPGPVYPGEEPRSIAERLSHEDPGYDERLAFLMDYLRDEARGFRVVFENMERWIDKKDHWFASSTDEFNDLRLERDFGFCLDVARAAVSGNYIPQNLLSPPADDRMGGNYDVANLLLESGCGDSLTQLWVDTLWNRIDQEVSSFHRLDIDLVHFRAVSIGDLQRNSQGFSAVSRRLLKKHFPFVKERNIPLILEDYIDNDGLTSYLDSLPSQVELTHQD